MEMNCAGKRDEPGNGTSSVWGQREAGLRLCFAGLPPVPWYAGHQRPLRVRLCVCPRPDGLSGGGEHDGADGNGAEYQTADQSQAEDRRRISRGFHPGTRIGIANAPGSGRFAIHSEVLSDRPALLGSVHIRASTIRAK